MQWRCDGNVGVKRKAGTHTYTPPPRPRPPAVPACFRAAMFASPRSSDPHATLGVRPGCSAADAKHAYHALMLRLHPDKHCGPRADSAGSQEKRLRRLVKVREAYEALTTGGYKPGGPAAAAAERAAAATAGSPAPNPQPRAAAPPVFPESLRDVRNLDANLGGFGGAYMRHNPVDPPAAAAAAAAEAEAQRRMPADADVPQRERHAGRQPPPPPPPRRRSSTPVFSAAGGGSPAGRAPFEYSSFSGKGPPPPPPSTYRGAAAGSGGGGGGCGNRRRTLQELLEEDAQERMSERMRRRKCVEQKKVINELRAGSETLRMDPAFRWRDVYATFSDEQERERRDLMLERMTGGSEPNASLPSSSSAEAGEQKVPPTKIDMCRFFITCSEYIIARDSVKVPAL